MRTRNVIGITGDTWATSSAWTMLQCLTAILTGSTQGHRRSTKEERQKPNDKSRTLSKDTIESYRNMPNIPFQPGIFFVTVRKLLGEKMCDELTVPPVSMFDIGLWHFARHFFILCCLLNSLCPPIKWLFETGFCKYIDNAFMYYFSTDRDGTAKTRSRCPFGV